MDDGAHNPALREGQASPLGGKVRLKRVGDFIHGFVNQYLRHGFRRDPACRQFLPEPGSDGQKGVRAGIGQAFKFVSGLPFDFTPDFLETARKISKPILGKERLKFNDFGGPFQLRENVVVPDSFRGVGKDGRDA